MNNPAIAPTSLYNDIESDSRIHFYKRNADFLRRILESSGDCIKVLDLEGHLLYMNDGGMLVMEIDNFERQVKGAMWLDFWQGRDRDAAIAAFKSASAGESSCFDGYCETAKGTPRWWNVALDPIYNDAGEIVSILSISRDVTQQRLATEALEARTQELDNFAYIASHDLKGPLRGIASIAGWIEEDLDDSELPETREHLQLLQERIARMNRLIEGLLNYSRVGREQVATELVDMNLLFQNVVDSMAPPADFKVQPAMPLPVFRAKEILLSQVVANLVSNAIRHHDKPKGYVRISVQPLENAYEFSVSDDGPGIEPNYRDKIFTIFQTLKARDEYESTGIGLSIVRKILTEIGGSISVESDLGQGTTFRFVWPKDPKAP